MEQRVNRAIVPPQFARGVFERVMANRNAMPKSGRIDWRDLKPRILKRCQDALRNDLGFLRIEPVIRVVAEALEQSSRYDRVGLMLVKHA